MLLRMEYRGRFGTPAVGRVTFIIETAQENVCLRENVSCFLAPDQA